ncbi:cyanase [Halorubrum gandharaense]
MVTREDATERLLAAKHDADATFAEVADAVGRDEVWTAALVMGETSADAAEADALVKFLDPEDADEVQEAVQRPPRKGDDDPTVPSDPMLYRLHEVPYVYGDAIKAVVHEEFGDGIMSAIDFECHVDRVTDPDGDRVRITYEGKFLPYKKW